MSLLDISNNNIKFNKNYKKNKKKKFRSNNSKKNKNNFY